MLIEFLFNFAGNADFMADNIRPIFQAINDGPIVKAANEAWYFTPMAGCLHLVALSLMGGAIILADLRVVGPGVQAASPAELNRKMQPFLITAVAALIFSGVLLSLGQVMRVYNSPPFWLKMAGLFSAIVFTFTTRDSVIRNNGKFSTVAIVGLVISMLVFWWSWLVLTDWRWAGRQAFVILAMMMVGAFTAPMFVPGKLVEPVRKLPQLVSLILIAVIVAILVSIAFLLAKIDYQYMNELDLNTWPRAPDPETFEVAPMTNPVLSFLLDKAKLAAFFHPSILAMMLVSFIAGIVSWVGIGAKEHQPMGMRFVSLMSILLWLTIAVSGRWIAFY